MGTKLPLAFFLPALISFLVTPLVIKLAWKLNLIDDPQKNRHPKTTHTYPVPRGGGLSIFLGILIPALLLLPIDKHTIAILTGAFLILVLGLLDDRFNLNPYLRILIQGLILTIIVISGISIDFISDLKGGVIDLSKPQFNVSILDNEFQIGIFASALTIFWVFFIMNVINMGAKGIDGQLPGVIVVSAIIIATLSLEFSADITQWPVIILAVITAGAYLGFLPWNFYPQKIMPSYSGSTLGGYLLAILAILSTTKVDTLIMILGLPITDTFYVIIKRILKGRSPVWGDRTHLHHLLLDSGISKRKIAVFYWLTSAVLGALALKLDISSKIYTIIGVATFIGGVNLWAKSKQKRKS